MTRQVNFACNIFWMDLFFFYFLHASNWILVSMITKSNTPHHIRAGLAQLPVCLTMIIDVHICATYPAELCREPQSPVALGLLTLCAFILMERNLES